MLYKKIRFMIATIILLAILFINLGIEMANHGKPRGGKHSFWGKLVAVIINLLLFYYAGLFDKFM